MKKVLIVSFGDVDPDILDAISLQLKQDFGLSADKRREVPVPGIAFNNLRGQYQSSILLGELTGFARNGNYERVLGVTGADLYAPGLNFVFGEARQYTGTTVISLARLRQEFYNLRPDKVLLINRAVKEAVHEIGHTYGFEHCPDLHCVMHFSNSLADTDGKGPGFCAVCGERLRDILEQNTKKK